VKRRGRTSARTRADQKPPVPGWWYLVGPVILLTALAFAAILFIYTCARESELDLQVRYAQSRVERLKAEHQTLCARINQTRDPAALREVAVQSGMVFTPAGVDRVALPHALPPQHVELSPLADLPLGPAAPSPPLPSDSLAHVPLPTPR
jgi:hypothetical protein